MMPLEGITSSRGTGGRARFLQFRAWPKLAPMHQGRETPEAIRRGYDAAAKGQSSYFVWLNGKASVGSISHQEGRASSKKLIAGADVCLQKPQAGSMDKAASRWRPEEGLSALICLPPYSYVRWRAPIAERERIEERRRKTKGRTTQTQKTTTTPGTRNTGTKKTQKRKTQGVAKHGQTKPKHPTHTHHITTHLTSSGGKRALARSKVGGQDSRASGSIGDIADRRDRHASILEA